MTILSAPETALRAELLEQLMRVCDDESLLYAFGDVAPGSRAAHTELGRLMLSVAVPLVPGSPLLAFLSGTPLDPHWRDSYPAAPESLWAHLEFLRMMYGTELAVTPEDPLSELSELALAADTDLAADV